MPGIEEGEGGERGVEKTLVHLLEDIADNYDTLAAEDSQVFAQKWGYARVIMFFKCQFDVTSYFVMCAL
jgi:hypothetical protein